MAFYKLSITSSGNLSTFGISAFHNNNLIKDFPSISENKDDMIKLVSICNESSLDICHLDDIIEDYLTDFSI